MGNVKRRAAAATAGRHISHFTFHPNLLDVASPNSMAEIRNYTMNFSSGRLAAWRRQALTCQGKLAFTEVHRDLAMNTRGNKR